MAKNELFNFINPHDNDKLSSISSNDLQSLITLLNNFYLELRSGLNLQDNVTFGLEIEMENAYVSKIEEEFKKNDLYYNWMLKGDGSLAAGVEVNSPVLRDESCNWNILNKVCSISREHAEIRSNSGGHIHVGAQIISEKQAWINFMKLWMVFEDIIYRFCYGEFLGPRPYIDRYAQPLAHNIYLNLKTLKYKNNFTNVSLGDIFGNNYSRNYGVNLLHVDKEKFTEFREGNTVEFRCPNGTLNPIIWQNNVNLLVKLLEYANSSKFDNKKIDNLFKKYKDVMFNFNLYSEINIQKALDLSDLIFDNNLDKLYFLRQYFKSFENIDEIKNTHKFVLANKFTKF